MSEKGISKREIKIKGTPTMGLAAATLAFFTGFAAVALIGPVGKEFKNIMGLSGLMLGLLVAAPQLTGSILRIPFGAWVDKVGGKIPTLALLGISIIGMIGLSYTLFTYYPNNLTIQLYPVIFLFAVLSGAGVAIFAVGVPQTSYWYPQKKQGKALGIFAGVGNIAPGIFTLIVPFAIASLGLPKTYLAWFLFLLAGTLVYLIIAHDAPYFQYVKAGYSRDEAIELARNAGEELIPSGKVIEALKISAKNWRTWALVALYFTSFGGFLALTTWLPSYWGLAHGIGIRNAAIITAIGFTILASLIRILGGSLSDKLGGEKVALYAFIIILIGAVIFTLASQFLLALIAEIIVAIGMGLANGAVFKLVPRYVPNAVGGATGWVGGLGAFGGFIVPPILGMFVDSFGRAGYSLGYITYIILAFIAILIVITLRSHPPK